ncbi:MAG: hypothetical protein DI536_23030 [Archangium gephyra]|uniref:Uncharacterized protein n=1 Tax=Archangium gephyra TaxID=48 RepID=A0A2W5T1A3_9BACT|nr:MAG: hypothetical protein DI536_23030 [Archangium gephyra]
MSSRIEASRSTITAEPDVDVPAAPPKRLLNMNGPQGAAVERFDASSSRQPPVGDFADASSSMRAGTFTAQQQQYLLFHARLTDGFTSINAQLEQAATLQDRNAMQALVVGMATRPEFATMLNEVPREWVERGIETMIRNVAPNATPAEIDGLTKTISAHIDQQVRTAAAQKLKKGVSEKLFNAAAQLERDSKDPEMLATMTSQLQRWESPSATPRQKELAASARDLLGLADGPVSKEQLAAALQSRAKLVAREADTMLEAGETTLYRSLALHSALGEQLLAEQGIKPGSWGEEGLANVKSRAGEDEGELARAKTATNLSLSFLVGAVGGGKAASTAAPIALNAGALASSYQHIDRAVAGQLAGTANDNAVSAARRKWGVELAEVGVASAIGGTMGSAKGDLSHAVKHAAIDGGLGQAAHAVEHWLHPHSGGPSSTMDALRGNE